MEILGAQVPSPNIRPMRMSPVLTSILKMSCTICAIACPPGTSSQVDVGQQKRQDCHLLGLKPPVSLCLLSWGDRRERAPPSHPSWTSTCSGPDMDQMYLRFCLSRWSLHCETVLVSTMASSDGRWPCGTCLDPCVWESLELETPYGESLGTS